MSPYKRFTPSQLILRDELALDRTRLANERTFLAYARTAIMLLVSGVSLIKLFPDEVWLEILGFALLPVGVALAMVGVLRFQKLRRNLALLRPEEEQEPPAPQESAGSRGDV